MPCRWLCRPQGVDFDLVLLAGYSVHRLSVYQRPRRGASSVLAAPAPHPPGLLADGTRRPMSDGRTADAIAFCLTSGHREPAHVLLAHPTSQRVLTADRLHACIWQLDAHEGGTRPTAPFPAQQTAGGTSTCGPSRPQASANLPVAEGRPCCACVSPSGGRWAIGTESGCVLLLDHDGLPAALCLSVLRLPPPAPAPSRVAAAADVRLTPLAAHLVGAAAAHAAEGVDVSAVDVSGVGHAAAILRGGRTPRHGGRAVAAMAFNPEEVRGSASAPFASVLVPLCSRDEPSQLPDTR